MMRLKLLNLKKLETRRQQQDIMWCYKILFSIVRVDPDAFFELHVTTTRLQGQNLFFSLTELLMFGISYQCRLLILQHCPPSKEPLTISTYLSYKTTNKLFHTHYCVLLFLFLLCHLLVYSL